MREVVEQVRECVRLEHRAVCARLERAGSLRARRLLRRFARDCGRVQVLRAPGCLLGIARTAFRGCDDERRRVRHALLDAEPGRGHDRELGFRRSEEAVHRNVAGCVDCSRRQPRLVVRPECCGRLVVALHLRRLRRRCETRERLIGRRTVRGRRCALRELRETFVVDPVRRRDPGAVPVQDPERDDDVLDQRRLVHLRACEAREPGALGVRDGFCLAASGLERRAGDVERAHDFTPTCTLRKRAGAAPCETCALWPGCPLPQFVSP